MHVEIDGFEIARALNGPERDALAAALVNCTFFPHHGVGDDGFVIEAADSATTQIKITMSNGSPHSVPIARGAVLPSTKVRSIVDKHRARCHAAYPDDLQVLRDAGLTIEPSREDAIILVRALRQTRLPQQPERYEILDVLKRHGLHELRIDTVRRWVMLVEGPFPTDLSIRAAKIYRDASEVEEALNALDRGLANSEFAFSHEAILLTQRFAVLLDLYEKTGDRTFLGAALEDYRAAYRMDPKSSYLASAKARFDRLR